MRRWTRLSEVGLAVVVIGRGTPKMRMMMDRWERKNLLGFWVWVQRNEKLLVASASPWRQPPQSSRRGVWSGIKWGCGFWRFGARGKLCTMYSCRLGTGSLNFSTGIFFPPCFLDGESSSLTLITNDETLPATYVGFDDIDHSKVQTTPPGGTI